MCVLKIKEIHEQVTVPETKCGHPDTGRTAEHPRWRKYPTPQLHRAGDKKSPPSTISNKRAIDRSAMAAILDMQIS